MHQSGKSTYAILYVDIEWNMFLLQWVKKGAGISTDSIHRMGSLVAEGSRVVTWMAFFDVGG